MIGSIHVMMQLWEPWAVCCNLVVALPYIEFNIFTRHQNKLESSLRGVSAVVTYRSGEYDGTLFFFSFHLSPQTLAC